MKIRHWQETKKEYKKGSPHFKEMLLLPILINEYERNHYNLPPVNPIKMIKIRMEDFGYKPADLAKEYGDKSTISKVPSYKQPLLFNMIRLFSEMLRIPADVFIKEYKLDNA